MRSYTGQSLAKYQAVRSNISLPASDFFEKINGHSVSEEN